ncbi:hypothetical protein SEA_ROBINSPARKLES_98 [Gordonia phage RobinSparkles]|nr:hypothetical protein SEA_ROBINSPARKLES_98 [Gordonia phage RobinSparkles]
MANELKVTIEFTYDDFYTGNEDRYPDSVKNYIDAAKFDLDSDDPAVLIEALMDQDLKITIVPNNPEGTNEDD